MAASFDSRKNHLAGRKINHSLQGCQILTQVRFFFDRVQLPESYLGISN